MICISKIHLQVISLIVYPKSINNIYLLMTLSSAMASDDIVNKKIKKVYTIEDLH